MNYQTLISLLLGALLFTFFTFGCEPEMPSDDDDDVSDDDDDDDTTDDDDDDVTGDDDTEDMYYLYITSECDGIEGLTLEDWPYKPLVYIDDELMEYSPTTIALKRGEHKIQVKGDTILSPNNFIVDVSEESEDIGQVEGNNDIDGEVFIRCGVQINGEVKAYLDENCTEPDPGNYTFHVETNVGFWDGSPDEIVMSGLNSDKIIVGNELSNESGSLTGWIASDQSVIYTTNGQTESWYCPID